MSDLDSRISALERSMSNIPLRVPMGGGGGLTFYTADTQSHLTTTGVTAPALGYTTTDKKYWAWSNSAWIGISHLA